MLELDCPYDQFELQIGLIGSVSVLEKREAEFKYLIEDLSNKVGQDLLKGMVEYYKLDRATLIASPNYEVLKKDFQMFLFNSLVKGFVSLGLTEVQAWALILMSMGKL